MEEQLIIANKVYANDIKFIRKHLNVTQKEFAQLANVSLKTVQGWEQGEKGIVGAIVPLVQLLFASNKVLDLLTLPQQEMPLRLWYMYRNVVCSVIDVDERKRMVKVYNYIDDILYRAFGKNMEPEFEDYEEFLESRCFPKTRDKMKIMLRQLDIPFYDPLMIIEKTEGKMAEDQFWIRIERK